jgi:hypothetical protein
MGLFQQPVRSIRASRRMPPTSSTRSIFPRSTPLAPSFRISSPMPRWPGAAWLSPTRCSPWPRRDSHRHNTLQPPRASPRASVLTRLSAFGSADFRCGPRCQTPMPSSRRPAVLARRLYALTTDLGTLPSVLFSLIADRYSSPTATPRAPYGSTAVHGNRAESRTGRNAQYKT